MLSLLRALDSKKLWKEWVANTDADADNILQNVVLTVELYLYDYAMIIKRFDAKLTNFPSIRPQLQTNFVLCF